MDSIEGEVLVERVEGKFAEFVPRGVEHDEVLVEVVGSLLHLFRKGESVGVQGQIGIGRHDDTVEWFEERLARSKVV